MSLLKRPQPFLVLWSAGIVAILLTFAPAFATTTCGNLPVSKFRLLTEQASGIDEYPVNRDEMDRIAVRLGVTNKERQVHPLMLMAAELDAHVAVQHRAVEVDTSDGPAFCDAPTSVVVAFGAVRRKVYLLQKAAADPCVRRALLAHYSEHSRALDREVQLFIHNQSGVVGMRVQMLKQRAALDILSANKAVEAGVWSIVKNMVTDFKHEMIQARQTMSEEIDSPERLDELRDACSGKIRKMENDMIPPETDGQSTMRERPIVGENKG